MRRLLALAVLVAFLPTAHAQDRAKADFSTGAEYRARYFWLQNPGANEKTNAGNSFAEHRMKLGLNFKASEKFSAHMTALHDAQWGHDNSQTLGLTNVNDTNNFLNVNEAYANWMFSDDMSFRIGRQNYQIADGYVMGVNDWEQNPYAFEGVVGNWEAEFGRFQVFAFKFRELGDQTTATNSASRDPEHNAYGLNFDLKTTPEWLKAVNVHVIKNNGDAVINTTAGGQTVGSVDGIDTLRYGLHGAFAFGAFDAKAWYAAHTGKYKAIATGGGKTETDSSGQMYQVEAGFNMDAFMGSRFYAAYHVDSGDKDTAAGDAETYDSYFYEKHANAGLMDLFGWGNLTYINVGWTLRPSDATTAGLSYYMFSRTESGSATTTASAPVKGRFGSELGNGDDLKDKLGDEIDLWAEHRYDGGLSTMLRLGYFMPGDYFEKATPKMSDAIMHVSVEAKLTF